jgi:hypothetical protein
VTKPTTLKLNPSQPLICLDIKISLEKTEQLLIYQNDDVEQATEKFA